MNIDYDKIKEWIEEHQLLCGIILVGIFTVIYILGTHRPHAKADLHVSFINEYNNVGKGSQLYKALLKNTGNINIEFDTDYYFNLKNDKDYSNSYFQKLVAYIEAGTTDAVIAEKSNISGIARGGRLLDLNDKRVADVIRKYNDRFYYYKTEEGETLPVAISLKGTKYEESLGYSDEVYVGISSSATHLEKVILLIDTLMED